MSSRAKEKKKKKTSKMRNMKEMNKMEMVVVQVAVSGWVLHKRRVSVGRIGFLFFFAQHGTTVVVYRYR